MIFFRGSFFVVLLLLAPFLSATCVFSAEVGYVDSRICMLSHPAFKNFDWKSRRFFNTISAPANDFDEEFRALKKQEEKAHSELKKVEKRIAASFSKKADSELWAKRKSLVDQLQFIKQRRAILKNLQETDRKIPGEETTWCTLEGVEKDLARIFESVKVQNKLDILMDSSALTPNQSPPEAAIHILQGKNPGFFLNSSGKFSQDEFVIWLVEARRFWQRKLPGVCNTPFKYGAKDMTKPVCEALFKITTMKSFDENEGDTAENEK